MSKLIVNEIEKYDAGQLTVTTGTNVSIGSNLTVGGSLTGTLSTAAQPNITSVGTLSSLAVSGNLTVDTNTLFVDAANNRVGVGTTSPASILDVRGSSPVINVNATNASGEAAINLTAIGSDGVSNALTQIAGIPEGAGLASAIKFQTRNSGGTISEKVRIDSSGRVGIGESNPDRKLHITDAATSVQLKLERTVSNTGSMQLGADGDGLKVFNNSLSNIVTVLSSGGLTFNGDTAAANALDDYEEGTYTPTLTPNSGTITLRAGYTSLAYTKIGRIVHIQGQIGIGGASTPTGEITFSLPYALGTGTNLSEVPSGTVNWFDDNGGGWQGVYGLQGAQTIAFPTASLQIFDFLGLSLTYYTDL